MLNNFSFVDVNYKHAQCAPFFRKILRTALSALTINFPSFFDTKNLSNEDKNNKNITLENNIRSNALNKKTNIQDQQY